MYWNTSLWAETAGRRACNVCVCVDSTLSWMQLETRYDLDKRGDWITTTNRFNCSQRVVDSSCYVAVFWWFSTGVMKTGIITRVVQTQWHTTTNVRLSKHTRQLLCREDETIAAAFTDNNSTMKHLRWRMEIVIAYAESIISSVDEYEQRFSNTLKCHSTRQRIALNIFTSHAIRTRFFIEW